MRLIKWYADAVFVVPEAFKSHTGPGMTLGQGVLIRISQTEIEHQELSTEGELVAVDDASGQIIWADYFIESLEYQVNYAIVLQESQSVILLEKMVKSSAAAKQDT